MSTTSTLLPGRHTSCRRCLAAIVWAVTDAGKRMPLDVRIDHTGLGNVAVRQDATGRLNARVLADGQEPYGYERRAMPHFATCSPEPTPADLPAGVSSMREARRRRGR